MLLSYTYIRLVQASIMNFRELPDGIAGVIQLFFCSFWLNLKWLDQMSWYFGGRFSSDLE
jgi:hypothetical protein